MTDDLFLSSSLDQITVVGAEYDDTDFLDKIRAAIEKAIEERNALEAIRICRLLLSTVRLSGKGLALVLYLLKKNWDVFGLDEEFEDFVYAEFGIHRYTVRRYVAVYENIMASDIVPEDIAPVIREKPIKELIPIAMAIDSGYDIDYETWRKIAEAPDEKTVSSIIRSEVREAPQRSGSIFLGIDTFGRIWAYANQERHFVGTLEVESDNETVRKAISRIVRNSGIMEV